jgi:NDP-sugar pyrophosphorylase family protein
MSEVSLCQTDIAILAGGPGTRLQSVSLGLPKVLMDLGEEPFLAFLLRWLGTFGAHRIVLCLGYGADAVLAYLEQRPPDGLEIVPSREPSRLGTAGALRHARPLLRTDPVIVLNGDSFVDVDLNAALSEHLSRAPSASMIAVPVENAADYGRVIADKAGFVESFLEKVEGDQTPGLVNAGVYFLSLGLLDALEASSWSSLEHDVFPSLPVQSLRVLAQHAFFLDIGTPERLAMATTALRPFQSTRVP